MIIKLRLESNIYNSSRLHISFPSLHILSTSILRRSRKLGLLNLEILITIIMNSLDNTTNSTTMILSRNDILNTHDVSSGSQPMSSDISENIDKSDKRNNI